MTVDGIAAAGWDCTRRAELALRQWPDGCVVYDEASGQIQCLTVESGEVMSLLLQPREWTSHQLAQAFLREVPTDDEVQMVENVVTHFLSLHLVKRLPH
jgi:hypothetical protein